MKPTIWEVFFWKCDGEDIDQSMLKAVVMELNARNLTDFHQSGFSELVFGTDIEHTSCRSLTPFGREFINFITLPSLTQR